MSFTAGCRNGSAPLDDQAFTRAVGKSWRGETYLKIPAAAGGSLVFSGDTTTNPALWKLVSAMRRLRHVWVETAFSDARHATVVAARHYCPRLLAADLSAVSFDAELLISHLKPACAAQIMIELCAALPRFAPRESTVGRVFDL